MGDEVFQNTAGGGQRFGGAAFFGGEGNGKRPFFLQGAERGGNAVDQPFFVAQGFHQAAVETAAAEDVVADGEGVAIGVFVHEQGQPHHDDGLFFVGERNVLLPPVGLGDVGDGVDIRLGGQAVEDGGGHFVGFFAADVADDGDVGVVFGVGTAVVRFQGVGGDGGDVGFVQARGVGVGVVAVVEDGERARGEEGGVAQALA